ncbi:MAG: hypothetical protein JNG88_11945 [Phycisphaerales bacterium]|nr:hypothetical protein [Phycisphaerales bacterium]
MHLTRLLIVISISGLCLGGCAGEKRGAARPTAQSQTKPAPKDEVPRSRSEKPAKQDAASTTSEPKSAASAPSPPASARPTDEGEASEPPAPAIPDYVLVLERFSSDKPYSVDARVDDAHRMTLRTTNVKRLQIRRAGSGLSQTRSVAIMIDQQGIEWGSKLEAVELERSINGAWRPVERK